MTEPIEPTGANREPADGGGLGESNRIEPLPGEPGIPDVAQRHRHPMSSKGLLALALALVSLIAVLAVSIQRFTSGSHKADAEESKRTGDRPAAATAEPRRLEMPIPTRAASSAAAPPQPQIPALVPTAEEMAEPIGVRRTASPASSNGGSRSIPPQDAPVLLVTTKPGAAAQPATPGRDAAASAETAQDGAAPEPNDPMAATTRNLQAYQRQLQGLLDTLTRTAAQAGRQATGAAPTGALIGGPSFGGRPSGGPPSGGSLLAGGNLLGGQTPGSAAARITASTLGNRSLTLPKGTAFTCALKTRVISATSGLIGCQVQRNVFSDDGRVLLIERGSHLDGDYRIASIRPGTVRIPVVWTRIRTPHGITVDIDSPGTGQLGESGIDGYVDNRWPERIGAAMLVSLINDAVQLVIQTQTNEGSGDTIIFPSTTASTSKLAEKVLDSTINIPPLIYQNQGGIVGIYVAHDVDFSSVYELQPTARAASASAAVEKQP